MKIPTIKRYSGSRPQGLGQVISNEIRMAMAYENKDALTAKELTKIINSEGLFKREVFPEDIMKQVRLNKHMLRTMQPKAGSIKIMCHLKTVI